MMTAQDFMAQALELAKEAFEQGEVPVGAVVVKDGQIIATGRNRREENKNALCHAEIEAIHNACQTLGGWRLWQCELYVTLEPCPMCAGAIVNARIPQVFFGAKDDKNGACGSALDLFQLPHKLPPPGHFWNFGKGMLGFPVPIFCALRQRRSNARKVPKKIDHLTQSLEKKKDKKHTEALFSVCFFFGVSFGFDWFD